MPIGPPSIAGLNGPDLKEFVQPYPPADGAPLTSGAGEVSAATGGSKDLLLGVSVAGLPNDCSKGLGSSEKWLLLWLGAK